jgi:subtilisin family serine protease
VAAAMDNQEGVVGIAPGARVRALKVLRENGNTVLGSLIAVVDFLTERKLNNPSVPMVVNISLGANVRTTRYNGLDEAIRQSISVGVVYVIAAGNDGIDAATVSPAHVAEAITVGAHNASNALSSFSNYCAVIDIHAPGENVLTLTKGNGLVYSSGTSLAAPHVAGAAALLLAQNPTLTPAQVRTQLLATARSTVTGVPSSTTNLSVYVGD